MAKFAYRAKNGPQDIVEGSIEAQDRDQAVEKISRLGYLPVSVELDTLVPGAVVDSVRPVAGSSSRVRSKEVTIFSRQLSSLIKSGVPILKALNIIAEQSESEVFRKILSQISLRVKEGKSFSSSLEAWPKVFSPFYIAMIKAGEDSGTLQESLIRIAGYRQKEEEAYSKMKAALAYPVLMALVGMGTVIFMFVFVMPRLTGIFSTMGEDLPLATRVVIGISASLKARWYYFAVGLAILIFTFKKAASVRAGRRFLSYLSLQVPVFNRYFSSNELARFCRTLEVLIHSGIPILKAIGISVPVLSNEVIKEELKESARDLEQGTSFGRALKKFKHFPPFVVSLVTVGEESGRLEEALAEIADTYEKDCDEAMKVATSLLEPLMILSMGLVVGFIVMAMLLPIFQINMMAR